MPSPLSFYKEVAKEYGVTDAHNVSPTAKISWVQEQVTQQRQLVNRLLLDTATCLVELEKAKDKRTQDAYRKKADDYRADLSQLVDSISVYLIIIDELRKEYPELKVEA